MKAMVTIVTALVLFVGMARAEEPLVRSLPASVVKTVPEVGSTAVDAKATTQIKVTFSKEMMDGSWSWSQISDETFPQIIGKPRYLDETK
jgi:hypothetical protein